MNNLLRLQHFFLRKAIVAYCLFLLIAPSTGICISETHTKKNITLQKILDTIDEVDLAEALMVRLAYKFGLNMYGKQMNDQISTIPHAKSIQVHPYPWFAAGAAAILAKEDIDGNISVVLIKEKRCPNVWYLPGGYAIAAPLAGGEKGLDLLKHSMKDEAEEEILQGNSNAYEHVAKKYGIDYSNPLWQSARIWDNDLAACMHRELLEEIGVSVKIEPELLLHKVIYSQETKIHTIVNTYLFNLKSDDVTLKPDNLEVDVAVWVPINEIKQNKINKQFFYKDSIIPLEVAQKINEAIKKIRANHFALGSQEAFLKIATLLGNSISCNQSEWQFSNEAYTTHKQLLALENELLTKLRQR